MKMIDPQQAARAVLSVGWDEHLNAVRPARGTESRVREVSVSDIDSDTRATVDRIDAALRGWTCERYVLEHDVVRLYMWRMKPPRSKLQRRASRGHY